MSSNRVERKLESTYRFLGKAVAWQCSRCGKMFFLDQIQEADIVTIAPHILAEFRNHSCSGPGTRRHKLDNESFGHEIIIRLGKSSGLNDEDRDRE